MNEKELLKFKVEFLEELMKVMKPLVESFKSHVDCHDKLIEDYLRKNGFIYESEKDTKDNTRYIG